MGLSKQKAGALVWSGCGISFQWECIVELLIPLKPPQTMQWKLPCEDLQGNDLFIVRETMHFPTYNQFYLLYEPVMFSWLDHR